MDLAKKKMKGCIGKEICSEEVRVMHVKTMEGLVGANTSMNLANTPMRTFKEAERRGDTETMERAMGFAGDLSEKKSKRG